VFCECVLCVLWGPRSIYTLIVWGPCKDGLHNVNHYIFKCFYIFRCSLYLFLSAIFVSQFIDHWHVVSRPLRRVCVLRVCFRCVVGTKV